MTNIGDCQILDVLWQSVSKPVFGPKKENTNLGALKKQHPLLKFFIAL